MRNADSWKVFALHDIFEIEYGNKLDLNKMRVSEEAEIAFVSRTASDNGVSAYVEKLDDVDPYAAGSLTVALGGSIGSAFLQPKPFYTGQNVAVLIHKRDIPCYAKLFIAVIIKKESDIRFVAFGRELNKHIKTGFTLKLPADSNGDPDYEYMREYMESFPVNWPQTRNRNSIEPENVENWQSFRIDEVFSRFETGLAQSGSVVDGEDCVYLGAKKRDNCIMKKCARNSALTHRGNCLVFICNGEGSVGYCNYMDRDFVATTDLEIGYCDRLNKYTGLFLVTVIDRERPRYSFGRKWRPHLKETRIKLPAALGVDGQMSPDWDYMERYVKSLPYGDAL